MKKPNLRDVTVKCDCGATTQLEEGTMVDRRTLTWICQNCEKAMKEKYKIPPAKELDFVIIMGNAPKHQCNICAGNCDSGLKKPRIATVQLTDDSSYDVILCSYKCQREFKNHPMADHYLVHGVYKVLKLIEDGKYQDN
jgi:hypothetical protein